MLEALIFDVDGTVAETEDLHRRAFNLAFARHGLDLAWDAREYRRLLRVAGGKERIERSLAERETVLAQADIREIHATKGRFYEMLLAGEGAPWRPGVRRLMLEGRRMGLRLALATTTGEANLAPLFAPVMGVAWRSGFEAVVAGDAVANKKPAPDVYLEALRRLRTAPERAIAFEDSYSGVQSARAAGLAVVAAPSGWLAGDDLSAADLVLEDRDMPSASEIAAWHGRRQCECTRRG